LSNNEAAQTALAAVFLGMLDDWRESRSLADADDEK